MSECDQEMPKSQITDQPRHLEEEAQNTDRGRDTEHRQPQPNQTKDTNAFFLNKVAKLERAPRTTLKTRT